MNEITYRPIGIIHSPFKEPEGTPIQAIAANGVHGTIGLFQEYTEGLEDLDGFSHVILIYHFHLAKGAALKVTPFMYVPEFDTRVVKKKGWLDKNLNRLLTSKDDGRFS